MQPGGMFRAFVYPCDGLIQIQHARMELIFTVSPTTQYEDYNTNEMNYKDSKLFIVFETQEIMEESLVFLRFNCPDEECVFVAKGWNDLKMHARASHGKLLWCVQQDGTYKATILIYYTNLVTFAYASRKFSLMSMHFTTQPSFEYTYHQWCSDLAKRLLERRMFQKGEFIHYASSAENAYSAMTNYSNTCVKHTKTALYAKVKGFATSSQ